VLYAAKCFWPGVTEDDLRHAAARARENADPGARAVFRGVLYLPGDELALCLFDAESRASAKRASEQAGMPCERVIESVWLDPGGKPIEEGSGR
jgi:hypothetical protein